MDSSVCSTGTVSPHRQSRQSSSDSDDVHLQVVADPLHLVDEEVDVGLGGCRVGDDHTEEVDLIGLWLVAHHGGP